MTRGVWTVALAMCVALGVSAAEKPRLTSHRGGRMEYDDNAVGGFRACLAAGVTRFETDVRLTKDGELVIMHDADPKRTTTYTGDLQVREMTRDEVTALTLKKSGEKVPTMQQVADVFRGRSDVFVEWELKEAPKGAAGEAYCNKLYAVASSTLEKDTYIFIGFDADILATMKRLHPDARIGLTTGRPLTKEFVDKAKSIGCCSVQPGLAKAEREPIDYAHANGLSVALWMANSLDAWKKARALGADAVTTDFPMKMLRQIREEK